MSDDLLPRDSLPKPTPLLHKRRYRRLLIRAGISIALTSVIPLLIMTLINYYQYQEAFHTELIRPVSRIASNAKRSLEFNLLERTSALSLVISEKSLDDLSDNLKLAKLLQHMKQAFGGFIDMGVIDESGNQISYAGPYRLLGKNYKEQDWFHEVKMRGAYISEVFMGHRNIPHFVIAVRHDTATHESYVLRATIDTDLISRQIMGMMLHPSSDAFLINKKGVLQTPSRFYGAVLQPCALPVPPYSTRAEVLETEDRKGQSLIVGYAFIERSPFVVMHVSNPDHLQEGWLAMRTELLIVLAIGVVLVMGVVVYGTRYMVNSIREVDIRRATVFHKMEYTNKMAAIGRLGAGVSHEINNPLAIINEKAGLMRDLFTFSEQMPSKAKVLGLLDSILKSVNRCSTITHRLLGFAKHMDVQSEKINLELLLKDVLSFLEKEASYRDLSVNFDIPGDLATIESDRGQLQQVFLNIVNNAFAAVQDGGRIDISMRELAGAQVIVSVSDNGMGIPQENLENIFEPFFTTKKGYGTGLGLSITYGIVEKLGGKISVKSKVGQGTTFTIKLPINQGYS